MSLLNGTAPKLTLRERINAAIDLVEWLDNWQGSQACNGSLYEITDDEFSELQFRIHSAQDSLGKKIEGVTTVDEMLCAADRISRLERQLAKCKEQRYHHAHWRFKTYDEKVKALAEDDQELEAIR